MPGFNLQTILEKLSDLVATYGLRVVGAIAILVIGRFVAGSVGRATRKALARTKVDAALIGFISALARTIVMAFVIIAALQLVGVQTTSIVAVLGAAGFAVALALQGSLSNFAAGAMILTFKPFRLGDFVTAGGVSGTVKEIGIFTTTLTTPDNQKIIVPNSQITGGTITNVTAYETRRLDLLIGVSYGDDLAVAKATIERVVKGCSMVLSEPEPVIAVHELGDSSVNFVVRPWVATGDYWATRWELTRAIKEELEKAGCSIPFPQRDVHLFQEQLTGTS